MVGFITTNNLRKQVANLEEELEKSLSKNASLTEELKSYKATISAFPGVKTDYDEKLKKMETKYKLEIDRLKTEMVSVDKAVANKVNLALKKMGVQKFPSDLTLCQPGRSDSELIKQFNSLSGVAQSDFFKLHEKELSRFYGLVATSTETKEI